MDLERRGRRRRGFGVGWVGPVYAQGEGWVRSSKRVDGALPGQKPRHSQHGPWLEPGQGRKADLLTLSPGGLQPSPRALPERPKSAGCPLPVPC